MTAPLAARYGPGIWGYAALVLAGAGVAAASSLIFAIDSNPGEIVWPLVLAPVAIAALPLLLPRRGTRLGAMLAMGVWCVITGMSIGVLLAPSLVALVVASVRESP